MKIYEKTWMQRSARAWAAGTLALLFVVALLMLLSHFSVLAEPTADLTVQKEANTAQSGPGDTLTYTISIRNNLASSVTLWFTDTLASELDYVPDSVTATLGSVGEMGGSITWTGSLSPTGSSQQVIVTFAAQITSTLNGNTLITNTAEVTGTGKLITATFETEVKPGELEISKRVSPSQAQRDDRLTYTIHITNVGYGLVDSAWLTDKLPTGLVYVDDSLEVTGGGTADGANNIITWTGSLDGLGTTTVSFAAVVDPLPADDIVNFVNTAKITGAGIPAQADVTATVIVTYTLRFPLIFRNYPPIPELNDIPNPSTADNSYTVSWQAVDIPVDRYVLQESTDANFSSVTEVWTTTATSQLVTKDTAQGTLYYRVRADKDDRWGEGPWSAVKSVALKLNYYDGFDSSSSGWTTHSANCCLSGCDNGTAREHPSYKYNLYYSGGRYHVNIPLDCRAGGEHGDTRHIYPATFIPGIERPTSETCIGLRGSFENWNPYWSFWGLVFAASSDKSTIYSLEVNNLGDWGIVKRTGYQYPGPNHPYKNETRTYIHQYIGGQRWPVKAGYDPNALMVKVVGNTVTLYINGEQVYSFYDGAISSLRRIGIMGGDWEISPTQIGYDYFYVDEGCDTY